MASRSPWTSALVLALAACDTETAADGSSSTGDAEPHATILVPIDASWCDDPKVVSVQARALQVGCEHPPPVPCTMPADPPHVLGDQASCPITAAMELGVVVHDPGEYQVDAVADRTPDPATSECFAESTQQRSLLVTTVDIDVHAVKMDLVGLGQPCPEP